jgi:hypothetical protein
MKDFLLYLWQLPQNLLGLLVIFFTCSGKRSDYWYCEGSSFGVSLGNYIIFRRKKENRITMQEFKHECGHQKQSLYLGWLYLLVIGLPSVLGNLYARKYHKSDKWYYSRFPENWADKLGKVQRD